MDRACVVADAIFRVGVLVMALGLLLAIRVQSGRLDDLHERLLEHRRRVEHLTELCEVLQRAHDAATARP